MICRLIGDDEAREFFAKDLKAAAAIGVDGKSRRSWALRQEQASQSGSNLLLQPSGSGLSALAEDQSDIEYDDDDSEIQLDAMQSVSGKARQRRKTNSDMPPTASTSTSIFATQIRGAPDGTITHTGFAGNNTSNTPSGEAQLTELADVVGQLSLNENSEIRYHGR